MQPSEPCPTSAVPKSELSREDLNNLFMAQTVWVDRRLQLGEYDNEAQKREYEQLLEKCYVRLQEIRGETIIQNKMLEAKLKALQPKVEQDMERARLLYETRWSRGWRKWVGNAALLLLAVQVISKLCDWNKKE